MSSQFLHADDFFFYDLTIPNGNKICSDVHPKGNSLPINSGNLLDLDYPSNWDSETIKKEKNEAPDNRANFLPLDSHYRVSVPVFNDKTSITPLRSRSTIVVPKANRKMRITRIAKENGSIDSLKRTTSPKSPRTFSVEVARGKISNGAHVCANDNFVDIF
ncbi:hypothetical protein GPJ56_000073 [Histomonas meleagridis]|uniref:uncharacterized protein n=1 Tax=Histomonas meleagridis TaxID=135588 RepID=UPI003559A19F|nr:hypothetical protein GPJ56_000073 [Histomonas meleagridis]KAH0805572.1 hypothetical protein GO595_001627 [Histomonas meleagridis]